MDRNFVNAPDAETPGLFVLHQDGAPLHGAWPLRAAELAVFHRRIRKPTHSPGIPYGGYLVRGKGAPRRCIPVMSHSASSRQYIGTPIVGSDDDASSMHCCVGTPGSANDKGNQARGNSGCN